MLPVIVVNYSEINYSVIITRQASFVKRAERQYRKGKSVCVKSYVLPVDTVSVDPYAPRQAPGGDRQRLLYEMRLGIVKHRFKTASQMVADENAAAWYFQGNPGSCIFCVWICL